MRKLFYTLSVPVLFLALVVPSLADTIRLKDGSVIHGQVVGFKDQQFTVVIGGGSKGRRSRTTIYVEDVESIEFDATVGSDNVASGDSVPVSQPPRRNTEPESPARTETAPAATNKPTFFTIKVSVRADNNNNGWTNSGLVVRKGQRLRVIASGRVDLGKRRSSTPEGLRMVTDSEKLMRNEPTGGLIAVIGDDNDDFIFLGGRREFVAQRDGVLFLGVNESDLTDNSGAYDTVIEAETVSGQPRLDSTVASGDSVPVSQPPRRNAEPESPARTETAPAATNTPTFFTIKVSVRADNNNNGWTNSGLVVRKGQRLRVIASGRVDLGKRRSSTPEGLRMVTDSEKLMRNEPTGGLIAVIGDDNDDFIFLGGRREFVVQRDGVLFLGVNEGDLADNSGTYDIVIEAEAVSGTPR